MTARDAAPDAPGARAERTERAVLERLRGTPLVLLLDVDGTLAPIAPRPQDAAVPAATRDVLARLAARHDTRVAVVSGRAADDALRLVGVHSIWAAGNHGFEFVTPDGTRHAHPEAAPFAPALREAVADLRAELRAVPGAIVEDKTLTISVHFRLVAGEQVDQVRESAKRVARARGLRASEGKMVVELRPPVLVDKGTAVLTLADALGAHAPSAAVLFAGDDVTDEDAFDRLRRGLPGAVTVNVGTRADTAAEFQVPNPAAFGRVLAALLRERAAAVDEDGAGDTAA